MEEVPATRYNSQGRAVESVTLAVSLSEDTVHLHITGERTSKHYYLPRELWEQLSSTNGIPPRAFSAGGS